jgi:hypothetical protein
MSRVRYRTYGERRSGSHFPRRPGSLTSPGSLMSPGGLARATGASRRNPTAFAIKVIVMRRPAPTLPPDVVYGALYGTKALQQSYRLAYSSPAYLVYEARTPSP